MKFAQVKFACGVLFALAVTLLNIQCIYIYNIYTIYTVCLKKKVIQLQEAVVRTLIRIRA